MPEYPLLYALGDFRFNGTNDTSTEQATALVEYILSGDVRTLRAFDEAFAMATGAIELAAKHFTEADKVWQDGHQAARCDSEARAEVVMHLLARCEAKRIEALVSAVEL